jgi:hypothetical protein
MAHLKDTPLGEMSYGGMKIHELTAAKRVNVFNKVIRCFGML